MLPTCILSQCIAYFANIDKDAEIRTTYYYVHVMSGGGKMPKVNVDDINVYYEVHGKGEPLAFIAGLLAISFILAILIREPARSPKG